MAIMIYRSWGFVPYQKQHVIRPAWPDLNLPKDNGTVLPYGNGRSYGDSCLNSKGQLIDTRSLNRVISFNAKTGVIRCEVGVLFSEVLELSVSKGWFLPVTPGTKFVTVGGAIANDVHGKNHHKDGTFGCHVSCFEILLSSGKRITCTPQENHELFSATIGGLGLTGLIIWAEFQLIKVNSSYIDTTTTTFYGLDHFKTLSKQANDTYQYSVAWLDCTSSGRNLGRGIFIAGNHSDKTGGEECINSQPRLTMPFNLPRKTLNRYTVSAFNTLYFHKNKSKYPTESRQHYDSFFYPLDSIGSWNRIYGKYGFYQYQFVVPTEEQQTLSKALQLIVSSGMGSFLAVLKVFGDIKSPGMLSFPRPGMCLALDFANHGQATLDLLNRLDELIMSAGGAVYPAKDSRMSGAAFHSYFPQHKLFRSYIDPQFCSDFWRRVRDV
jgi:FAD/FMN-containing dehydrogenase